MPDLAARLTKVFGQRVIADKAMQAIADLDRGTICAYLFHIAAARQLGCEQFLTFDIKQTAMAKAVGLAVKPEGEDRGQRAGGRRSDQEKG